MSGLPASARPFQPVDRPHLHRHVRRLREAATMKQRLKALEPKVAQDGLLGAVQRATF